MTSRNYLLPDEWAYVVEESSYATSTPSDATPLLLTEPVEVDPSISVVERDVPSGHFGTQVNPHNFVEVGVSFTMVVPKLPWLDGTTLSGNPLEPVMAASKFEFTESSGAAGADSHTYTFSLNTNPSSARSMTLIAYRLADKLTGGTRQISEIEVRGVVGTVELSAAFGEMITLSFEGSGIVDDAAGGPFWKEVDDPGNTLVTTIPEPTELNGGYRGFVTRPQNSNVTYQPITQGAQRISSLTASVEGSVEQLQLSAGDGSRVVHEQTLSLENPMINFTTPHVEEDLASGGITDEWETRDPTTQSLQCDWTQDSGDSATDTSQLKVIADHYHPTEVTFGEEGGRKSLEVSGVGYHEAGNDNLTIEIESTEL